MHATGSQIASYVHVIGMGLYSILMLKLRLKFSDKKHFCTTYVATIGIPNLIATYGTALR